MPRAFSALIKPASSGCNMRCRYCFYADEAASRAVANYGLMSPDTLEALVTAAFDYATGPVSFTFQGGEPTLAGLEFYQQLILLEKKHNTRRLPVNHALQTNGLLIDDKWAAFLKEHNFLVGLSMDGYGAVHDGLRPDAKGEGTFSRVREAAQTLARHHVDYNILCVVSKPVAGHGARVYGYLRDHGFLYQQYIPCLDPFSGQESAWSLTARDYGRFLVDVFRAWYDDFTHGRYISIRHIDNYVGMLMGCPPESCGMAGVCMSCMTVEGDGSVYPCDFYVLDEWRMGNVNGDSISDLMNSPAQRRFVESSLPVHEKCRSCQWYPLCRGGCRRHRDQDGALGLNRFCESYDMFFSACLGDMQKAAAMAQRKQRGFN